MAEQMADRLKRIAAAIHDGRELYVEDAQCVGRVAEHVAEHVAALAKARGALQRMMDTWLDYHDAHSLTQPVTGASANAFDDALAARDEIDALINKERAPR